MTSTYLERSASSLDTLWLDLTRKCQLACVHCYNDSGPEGTHGTMTRDDWFRVIDEAAECGVRRLQLIGGEPTMHPDFAGLVVHARARGLDVEVFSNLVHITDDHWTLFQRSGTRLATSYYSAQPDKHNAMTGRRSYERTRANIATAVRLDIPIRVGIIAMSDDQDVEDVRRDLASLGVSWIHVDHVRPFGRGSDGVEPDTSQLCGGCGAGKASVDPSGNVSPCVFSTWMQVGRVQHTSLRDIISGSAMRRANEEIRATTSASPPCEPDMECSPGYPGSGCNPRT